MKHGMCSFLDAHELVKYSQYDVKENTWIGNPRDVLETYIQDLEILYKFWAHVNAKKTKVRTNGSGCWHWNTSDVTGGRWTQASVRDARRGRFINDLSSEGGFKQGMLPVARNSWTSLSEERWNTPSEALNGEKTVETALSCATAQSHTWLPHSCQRLKLVS